MALAPALALTFSLSPALVLALALALTMAQIPIQVRRQARASGDRPARLRQGHPAQAQGSRVLPAGVPLVERQGLCRMRIRGSVRGSMVGLSSVRAVVAGVLV